MKVFQIQDGFCYNDMTPKFPALNDTFGKFAPNIHIVEAPDYVFEGWGYDYSKTGDACFIQPTPPEGWLYDNLTGRFYLEGETPPSQQFPGENRVINLEEENALLLERLAEVDEIAIDLYEANLSLEAINAEQDEAIIEIYELMEVTNNG